MLLDQKTVPRWQLKSLAGQQEWGCVRRDTAAVLYRRSTIEMKAFPQITLESASKMLRNHIFYGRRFHLASLVWKNPLDRASRAYFMRSALSLNVSVHANASDDPVAIVEHGRMTQSLDAGRDGWAPPASTPSSAVEQSPKVHLYPHNAWKCCCPLWVGLSSRIWLRSPTVHIFFDHHTVHHEKPSASWESAEFVVHLTTSRCRRIHGSRCPVLNSASSRSQRQSVSRWMEYSELFVKTLESAHAKHSFI